MPSAAAVSLPSVPVTTNGPDDPPDVSVSERPVPVSLSFTSIAKPATGG